MVRFQMKGGVWTNAEDEILKAGVMKYGLNSWGRIASLFHKKTAAQCKTRWEEWLNPNIKKNEWDSVEDEKLIYYARIFTNQWRTIGPLLHRTAGQCLERFMYLSDIAMGKDPGALLTTTSSTNTGLGGGLGGNNNQQQTSRFQFDPNFRPENRPARPDAIDVDEAEQEMIQTATARLANTEGKKGKRRARERALNSARELSKLQKLREMKAAGITIRQDNKADLDLINPIIRLPGHNNNDTFDTTLERQNEHNLQSTINKTFIGKSVGDLEKTNTRKQRLDEQKRIDMATEAKYKEANLPGFIAQLSKANTANIEQERGILQLPDVISSTTKPSSSSITTATQNTPSSGSGDMFKDNINALRQLKADRKQDTVLRGVFNSDGTVRLTNLGTKRSSNDSIKNELNNINNNNNNINNDDLKPSLPIKRQKLDDENIKNEFTQLNTIQSRYNNANNNNNNEDNTMSLLDQLNALPAANDEKPTLSLLTQLDQLSNNNNISNRDNVLSSFFSLERAIQSSDDKSNIKNKNTTTTNNNDINISKIIDSDLIKRIQQYRNNIDILQKTSRVKLNNLPIPNAIHTSFDISFTDNTNNNNSNSNNHDIAKLIKDELVTIMKNDIISSNDNNNDNNNDIYSSNSIPMMMASKLVNDELNILGYDNILTNNDIDISEHIDLLQLHHKMKILSSTNPTNTANDKDNMNNKDDNIDSKLLDVTSLIIPQHNIILTSKDLQNIYDQLYNTIKFNPKQGIFNILYNNHPHIHISYIQDILLHLSWVKNISSENIKLQNKVNIQLGGYTKRFNDFTQQINDIYTTIQKKSHDLSAIQMLLNNERIIIQNRIDKANDDNNTINTIHKTLQETYDSLRVELAQIKGE